MSWGVDFKADIFLSRQNYEENPVLVQDRIDELSRELTDIEARIKMFASANPNDIAPEEWKEEKIRFISNQIDELLEQHKECHTLRDNLYLYLDYLNKKSD